MKRFFTACVFAAIILSVVGCSTTHHNRIMQISTIDAILAGAYDGQMTCGEMITYGDFGIGTFDRLDGEMVVLNGVVYQVKADGKVYTPDLTLKTPFASVVSFDAELKTKLPAETDYDALKKIVDRAVPNMNIFCAVKVTGHFATVKTRSVPAQNKPYPPLTKVTKNQAIFNLENVSGTIVGFRSPAYVKGINVPGYHIHFLADDRMSGGHILAFNLDEGFAEIDPCYRFLMILPEGEGDFSRIDLGVDRSKDLDKAER